MAERKADASRRNGSCVNCRSESAPGLPSARRCRLLECVDQTPEGFNLLVQVCVDLADLRIPVIEEAFLFLVGLPDLRVKAACRNYGARDFKEVHLIEEYMPGRAVLDGRNGARLVGFERPLVFTIEGQKNTYSFECMGMLGDKRKSRPVGYRRGRLSLAPVHVRQS